MKVFFSQTHGETVSLDIEPEQTAEEVIALLLSTEKFPYGTFTFIYMGKILIGDTPFVNVKPGTRVIVYVKKDVKLQLRPEEIKENFFWEMPIEVNEINNCIAKEPALMTVLYDKLKRINASTNDDLVMKCLNLLGKPISVKQPIANDADAMMMQLSDKQKQEVYQISKTYGVDIEIALSIYDSANRNLDAAVQSLS